MILNKEVGTLKQQIATEMLLRKYAKIFDREIDRRRMEREFFSRFASHYEKELWEKFDGEIDDYIDSDPEMKAFHDRLKKSVSMEDFENDLLEEIGDSYSVDEDEDPGRQIEDEIEAQLNVPIGRDYSEEKEQALFHCSVTMLVLYMARERAKTLGFTSEFFK